jgi:hypothetical protein
MPKDRVSDRPANAGWAPNQPRGRTFRVVGDSLTVPTRFPTVYIPDGHQLYIKAWPDNDSWVFTGFSPAEAMSDNHSWPLLPNEPQWYQIEDAAALYLRVLHIGDSVVCTVEQGKGG